jgi:hypothetical protein
VSGRRPEGRSAAQRSAGNGRSCLGLCRQLRRRCSSSRPTPPPASPPPPAPAPAPRAAAHLGQRAHAHGGAHVVGEDEEGGAVGDDAAAVQAHAVDDGAHAVLAHAEAHVALVVGALLEVAEHLHQRQVGGRQVGGAAHQAGQHGGQRVEHDLAVLAGRQGLVLGRVGGQRLLPARGQLAGDQLGELLGLLGVLGLVRGQRGVPLRLRGGALLHVGAHGVVHVLAGWGWRVGVG